MGRAATPILLTEAQRAELEGLSRRSEAPERYRERARIILMAAEGKTNLEIAKALKTRPSTVSKWRTRFQREGLRGLHDNSRTGRPPSGGEVRNFRRKLLDCLDESPPKGYDQWNGNLLAGTLGVKPDKIWKELRTLGINLQRRRTWSFTTELEFACKSADIVGLYLGPPSNAVVLSLEEQHATQPDEEEAWLRMPDGKTLSEFVEECEERGRTDLLTALEIATGQVSADRFPRKRKNEFSRFLDSLTAQYPHRQLSTILDNLDFEQLSLDAPWRMTHPGVEFHVAPTHNAWLSQIEIWFSLLSRSNQKQLHPRKGGELVRAIESFVETYHENAQPFEWTKNCLPRPSECQHKDAEITA